MRCEDAAGLLGVSADEITLTLGPGSVIVTSEISSADAAVAEAAFEFL